MCLKATGDGDIGRHTVFSSSIFNVPLSATAHYSAAYINDRGQYTDLKVTDSLQCKILLFSQPCLPLGRVAFAMCVLYYASGEQPKKTLV